MLKETFQDLEKLPSEKPNFKKSKALTSSPKNNFKKAKIRPNWIGTSIIAAANEATEEIKLSFGKILWIALIAIEISKEAKTMQTALPHLPSNFLRASVLKSEEIIKKPPFIFHKNMIW